MLQRDLTPEALAKLCKAYADYEKTPATYSKKNSKERELEVFLLQHARDLLKAAQRDAKLKS